MAISLTNYVNITSGEGAGVNVPTRDLILRVFTGSTYLPPQTFLQFTSASQVGSYFGLTSEEYYRAVFYFSFISKTLVQPQAIQYARWVESAVAAMVFSAQDFANAVYTTWNAVTSGSVGITINGVALNVDDINFSAASSLANVASILTSAIQAQGTGSEFTSAVVTYSATYPIGFTLTSGTTAAATISIQAGVGGTDISGLAFLGWLPQATYTNQSAQTGAIGSPIGSIWSAGSAVETIAGTLTTSNEISNNFGSFLFLNNLSLDLTQVESAATWNTTAPINVLYLYCIPVSVANASAWSPALSGTAGCCLTLAPLTTQYPEQFPAMIEAATNYAAPNGVQNYMFQIDTSGTLTPSVTTDSFYDIYTAENVNFYGQTQTAGSQFSFYQQGVMVDESGTSIPTISTYVNEIWFKDAASAAILSLLLSLPEIAANSQGESQILATLQGVINLALNNGTIEVGKTLSTSQQAYITSASNDPTAWYQVQNAGYWVNCIIQPIPDNPTQYEAVYTLIYSKNDTVNFVQGTQTLI